MTTELAPIVYLLTYALVDAPEQEKEFNRMVDVREFLEGIGERMFKSVSLLDEDTSIEDWDSIVGYCLMWENL